MKIRFLGPILGKLYRLLSGKHKLYLVFLIFLAIGFSLVETLGISAIMPFISIASNPSLLDSGWYKKAFDFFGFAGAESFIIFLGVAIICFYLFRAVFSVVLTWLIARFSRAIYKYLSGNLFRTYLSIPYTVFAQKNPIDFVNITASETNTISAVALNILQASIELFTIALVYVLMVVINWKMTLAATAILLIIVLGLTRMLIVISRAQGTKRTEANLKIGRTLREAFGNFKFLRLKGNEENFLRIHGESLAASARAEVITNTIGLIPKSILESFGFSLLIAAVIVILWLYHDASKVIPLISMYALALYRILPAIHRLLGNVNNIAFSQRSLDLVYENIRQPVEREGSVPAAFEKSIRLEDVSFRYPGGGGILTSVSLEIAKGEKIAVTGESGSGKTTLVDLLIGIHKPVSGSLYVDDTLITDINIRSWRSRIGYIPQSIYLFDGAVSENVVFGSAPDEARIRQVLEMANIWDFLAAREGIHTRVGEGGIQLSGGQQQRIGIARALYDDPDVLVLDEATSALDNETETKIMDEIYSNVSKNKTLIVIAHRLSTVERCDRRIRIEDGKIIL